MNESQKRLVEAIRSEFQRHRFDVFVDDPPSVAQGGKGVVVPGCAVCKIQLQTVERFVTHLSDKVLEAFEKQLNT